MASKRKRRRGRGGGSGQAAALRPAAAPPEPASQIQWVIPRHAAGVRVNEDTALTVPAVWAATRLLSESLAALPWHVYRRRADGGRDPVPSDAADTVLHVQANEETSAFHWRETTVAHALLWGNGYSEIEPDLLGRPAALWQITPDRVRVVRSKMTGRIEYEVHNGTGSPDVLKAERMYHLKGLGFDGLVGYSVVRMAARSLGLAIAQETYGSSFFSNDATPGGVLKTGAKLNKEQEDRLRESWSKRFGGPYRKGGVAILHGGLEWQTLGMPNEDAQFLESRQFTITDVARWFRVPPHKIADLLRATFSNIEQQELDFVTDSLMPWVRRLESEADMKLIAEPQRGKLFTKLNLMGRLRGDSAARINYFNALLDRGILTVNEVRQIEDMNPIGPDGDKRFVAMNMQLLEDAGEEEEPPPAPPAPPAAPAQEEDGGDGEDDTEDDTEEELRSTLLRSLVPPWEKAVQQEAASLRKLRKGTTAQRRAGLVGEQSRSLRELFGPVLHLACHHSPSGVTPDGLLDELVKRYLDNLRERLDRDDAQRWDGLSWLLGQLDGRANHAAADA